jgi:hypothetical protein
LTWIKGTKHSEWPAECQNDGLLKAENPQNDHRYRQRAKRDGKNRECLVTHSLWDSALLRLLFVRAGVILCFELSDGAAHLWR